MSFITLFFPNSLSYLGILSMYLPKSIPELAFGALITVRFYVLVDLMPRLPSSASSCKSQPIPATNNMYAEIFAS